MVDFGTPVFAAIARMERKSFFRSAISFIFCKSKLSARPARCACTSWIPFFWMSSFVFWSSLFCTEVDAEMLLSSWQWDKISFIFFPEIGLTRWICSSSRGMEEMGVFSRMAKYMGFSPWYWIDSPGLYIVGFRSGIIKGKCLDEVKPMQRIFTAAAALLLCLLFLGSTVVAHDTAIRFDSDDDDSSDDDGASDDDSADDRVLRARLTNALRADALTDAERMKIKEKFITQGRMRRDEIGIDDEEISDVDAAVLASLGISIDRLRQFKTSDELKEFVMKIKERNSDLLERVRMEKKYDDDLDSVKMEKKAIREEQDKAEKLKKLGELLRKLAKERLANAAAEARIQAQLDRIAVGGASTTVILNDIEQKLKLEVHQVRTEHLTKKGLQILEKAAKVQEKLDVIFPKLEAAYADMEEGSKKEVVKKALDRLTDLRARLDTQVDSAQAAYDAFIAPSGNTAANAKVLNKEMVALKVVSHRTAQAARIVGHIIYRLNNATDDSPAAVQEVSAEVDDSIDSVDEVEVEIEVEAEVVDETTTTTATADTTTGGETA